MTTDSQFDEILALTEDDTSDPTPRPVSPHSLHTRNNAKDSATQEDPLPCHLAMMMNEMPPIDPILWELPGFAHLGGSSSGTESNDSSSSDDDGTAWMGVLNDPFEPLLGSNIQNDWAVNSNQQPQPEEESIDAIADLAGCGIVSTPSTMTAMKPKATTTTTMATAQKVTPPPPSRRSLNKLLTPKTTAAPKKAKKTLVKRRRTRRNKDPEPSQRRYVTFKPDRDVAMGRGGKNNKSPGNLLFHEEKKDLQPAYHAATKEQRTVIAQRLVDGVRAREGRFVKYDPVAAGWFVVSNHTARTKASQALRERYTREERAEKRLKYRSRRKAAAEQEEEEGEDEEDLLMMMEVASVLSPAGSGIGHDDYDE